MHHYCFYLAGEAGDVLVQGILDQETHSDVIPDRRKCMMTLMMTWMMMNKCHYEIMKACDDDDQDDDNDQCP